MATIKRHGARKAVADGIPSPGMMNFGTGGLQFTFTVNGPDGYYWTVQLSHVERDSLIEAWTKMEKDFEHG